MIPDVFRKHKKVLRDPPKPKIKGEPGSTEHQRSVLRFSNEMYDHYLNGPYVFDSPSPEKAYRASGIRNTVIREFGYKPVVRPGGTQLKWMGVPEKNNKLSALVDKDFRAGMKLKKHLEKEGSYHHANYRAESAHYKMMGDTLSQSNMSRRATEVRKHYEDEIEKVYRQPKGYGKQIRENKGKYDGLYEPWVDKGKLYKRPRRKRS
jgi:hypothetical protein